MDGRAADRAAQADAAARARAVREGVKGGSAEAAAAARAKGGGGTPKGGGGTPKGGGGTPKGGGTPQGPADGGNSNGRSTQAAPAVADARQVMSEAGDSLTVEGTGDTVGEARWAALRELERQVGTVDPAVVEIVVVSEGERGLLGVGREPARVLAAAQRTGRRRRRASPSRCRLDLSEPASAALRVVEHIARALGPELPRRARRTTTSAGSCSTSPVAIRGP